MSGVDYAVQGMSMSEIKEFVVATYMGGVARKRMPKAVYCEGAPGEGKTFTMFAAAREIGRLLDTQCGLIDVPTSCLEPCDVAGVPMPIKVGGEDTYAKYLGMEWAWFISVEYEEEQRKLKKDPEWCAPPMIILFDDLVAAHFQTQSAFFKGVHEGKWASLKQRDNVMVVGCGNRVEDNAAANDMPTALANRFRFCYANPTTEDWIAWGREFVEEGEEGIEDESRVHPTVLAFHRRCQDMLREFSADVANRSEKAFGSPRTWHDVSELLYEGQLDKDNTLFARAVMGIVGRGLATHFLAFLRHAKALIAPDEIIKDPKKARIPTRDNLDAIHATVSSLETHLKQNPKKWKAGIIYGLRDEMPSDIGILLVQTISEIIAGGAFTDKQRGAALGDSVWIEVHDKFAELLDVATD
jgi:hypothetical protein